tara:strand:+ start:14059 stop:16287 length:2229 start_codon:yes stop_codon:yes gene_type:complete
MRIRTILFFFLLSLASAQTATAKAPSSRPVKRVTKTAPTKKPPVHRKKTKQGVPSDLRFLMPAGAPKGLSKPKKRVRKKPKKKKRLNYAQRMKKFEEWLAKASTGERIDALQTNMWDKQLRLVESLVAEGTSIIPQLHEALKHKHLRIQLLSAIALARLGDTKAIPVLIKRAKEFYDQPASLILGAIIEYKDKIVPHLLTAARQTKHPQIFLRALGYLRSKRALPLLQKWLSAPNKKHRYVAREILKNYSQKIMIQVVQKAFQSKPSADVRAELIRIISFIEHPQSFETLLKGRKDPSDAIQFLSRLTLEGRAQEVFKQSPVGKLQRPPKSKAPVAVWEAWWKRNKATIKAIFEAKTKQTLSGIPTEEPHRLMIIYRTLHPMFSYGRMPIVLYDKRFKPAAPPLKGKYWQKGLAPEVFAKLLRSLQRQKFFSIPPKTGYTRDISVRLGNSAYTITAGQIRHLAFEAIERHILVYARQLKVGLRFEDFYRRHDEADTSAEGQIGQWAYRKADQLPPAKWSRVSTWKPSSDVESLFSALKDIFSFIPSRTRIVSIDVRGPFLRMTTLLFGSRAQSKYTQVGLERSRRLKKLNTSGLGVIYLTRDKIEQMVIDCHRLQIPYFPAKKKRTRIDVLKMLSSAFQAPYAKLLALSVERKGLTRIAIRWAAKDAAAIIKVLGEIAMRSGGDRVLAFRINHSGRKDRADYRLIVQMQWELKDLYKRPKRTPHYIPFKLRKGHLPFVPVYR